MKQLMAALLCSLLLAGCGGGGGGGGGTSGGDTDPPPVPGGPSISGFSPASGAAGDEIRITGFNFSATAAQNAVRFNGVTAVVVSSTTTEIVATVPAGASTGKIQVQTSSGIATSSGTFTVLAGSGPGATFTTRLHGPNYIQGGGIAWNGTRFVLVNSEDILRSTDAWVWTNSKTFVFADGVAWNGSHFVAFGSTIYRSADGVTWTQLNDTFTFTDRYDIVGSPTMWVIVGEEGFIQSSPDGITWTTRTSHTTKNLVGVAWNGTSFVAVGNNGTVVTSPNGIDWTLQTPPTTNAFTAVGGDSSLFVASTFSNSAEPSRIYTSPDGVTWTPRADFGTFSDIIYAGGRWLAAGFGAATSTDGVTWTQHGIGGGSIESVTWDGTQFVAMGSNNNSYGAVFVSDDGATWSLRGNSASLTSIARSTADGRIVAIGATHSSQTSTDGAAWTLSQLSTNVSHNYPFLDVVYAPSVGAFIGLVQVAANEYVYSTTDGATWSEIDHAPCQGSLAANDTVLVNVGVSLSGACLATSTDAMAWTPRTTPSGLSLHNALWTGGQFVAVGTSGAIATSPDGVDWTARTSGVTASLYAGAASPTTIVLVGGNGTILTSPDGVTWTARSSGVTNTLKGITWTGSAFFAVGSAGTLLKSSDGVAWTKLTTPYTSRALNEITWLPSQNRLLIVGDNNLTMTSP